MRSPVSVFLLFCFLSGPVQSEYTWNGSEWQWVEADTSSTPLPALDEGSGGSDSYYDKPDDTDTYNYDDDYYFDYNNGGKKNAKNRGKGESSVDKFSLPQPNNPEFFDQKTSNSFLNTDDEDLINGGAVEGSGSFNPPPFWSEPEQTESEGSGMPPPRNPSSYGGLGKTVSKTESSDIDIDPVGTFDGVNIDQGPPVSVSTERNSNVYDYDKSKDYDKYDDYYDNYDNYDNREGDDDDKVPDQPYDTDISIDFDDKTSGADVELTTTTTVAPFFPSTTEAATTTTTTSVAHRQPDVIVVSTEQPAVSYPVPSGGSDDDADDIAKRPTNRPVSFFAQPGILAAVIGGAVVGLLCAILLVMFIVYRMRKKDEGSYILDEPSKQRTLNGNVYSKTPNREFYA